jgi:sigma-54 dependent transcriptional regulator, acetoin dehydrogenase operon transcriptional activator AcoR
MAADSIVAAVGEAGSGRATLLAQAARHTYPRDRILSASAPDPSDIQTWLGLWTPELGKAHTAVIVRDVDMLPTWVAERLRGLVVRGSESTAVPFAVTAERFEDIPAALAGLVDKVVSVPPLRDRPDDVVPLARHVATRARGREVDIIPAAARALRGYDWPGNVDELSRVVSHAAVHADVIDINQLPPQILAGTTRHLSRIEAFERGEIVRVCNDDGLTMAEAAADLGMSRATLYRKIAQYNIHVPREHR